MQTMPKVIGEITLYTLLELSELLGVTDVTLRRYIKQGKLRAQKIGGTYHITEENLKVLVSGDSLQSKHSKQESMSAKSR